MIPLLVAGGISIASSLMGGLLGSKASKEAARRAREIGQLNYTEFMRQAKVEGELGNDQVMNLLEQQAKQKGTVEGMYSKSGLLMTGTPAMTMDEMQQDFDYNVDQAQESVSERVRRIEHSAKMSLLGAEARASGYDEQAKGDLIQAGFGAAKGAFQMYSGWGQNSPEISEPTGSSSIDYGMFNPQMNTINAASSLKGFSYNQNLGSKLKGFGY